MVVVFAPFLLSAALDAKDALADLTPSKGQMYAKMLTVSVTMQHLWMPHQVVL
jgi:hypothetical protein